MLTFSSSLIFPQVLSNIDPYSFPLIEVMPVTYGIEGETEGEFELLGLKEGEFEDDGE